MSDIYKKLEKLNTGILYEREMERAFVQLLQNYAVVDEGLENTNIYTSVRGVPLVRGEAVVDGVDPAEAARLRSSYIVVICTGYKQSEGEESCSLRIAIATNIYDGTAQEDLHEKWCAAVRGIMSPAALVNGVLDVINELNFSVQVSGWERDEQEAREQYIGGQWVHEATYHVYGILSGV